MPVGSLRPETFWKPRSLDGAVLARLSSPVDICDCRQRFMNAGAKYVAPNMLSLLESRETISLLEEATGPIRPPPPPSSAIDVLAGEPKKKPVFLRRRSRNQISTNMTEAPATPPTTPPTILPVVCGLSEPDPESDEVSEPGEAPVFSELLSLPWVPVLPAPQPELVEDGESEYVPDPSNVLEAVVVVGLATDEVDVEAVVESVESVLVSELELELELVAVPKTDCVLVSEGD